MSDSLDSAASAFSAAISGNTNAQGEHRSEKVQSAPEPMFDNLGELETDSGFAGGDELPNEGEVKERAPKQQRRKIEEEEVDEELSSGDEGDGEEDGEGADEDDEVVKDPEEDEEDDVYEVIVDGERAEVGIREALNGYIRQETFHKRLNVLNEQKEVLRTEAIKVIDDRKKLAVKLAEAEALLSVLVPEEPNWDQEYTRDPKAAGELRKQWDKYVADKAKLKTDREEAERAASEEDAESTKLYNQAENMKILRNNPKWAADKKVMTKDLNDMAKTAIDAGFSQEEVIGTRDSRMITILKKAMMFDRLQANKPQPIKRGKTPVKPGAGSVRTAPKNLTKAQQHLRKTGSLEAAGNVFAQIIKD